MVSNECDKMRQQISTSLQTVFSLQQQLHTVQTQLCSMNDTVAFMERHARDKHAAFQTQMCQQLENYRQPRTAPTYSCVTKQAATPTTAKPAPTRAPAPTAAARAPSPLPSTSTQHTDSPLTSTQAPRANKHKITPTAPNKHSQKKTKVDKTEDRTQKKLQQFANHSDIAFISDSIFKFMIDDKTVCLKYITSHQMERNIRIRRGLRSDQIVDLADVQLQQLASTGVKNVVVTFGVNDIQQTHLQDVKPDKLAQSVADCVIQFVNIARTYNISVVYVTPGYTTLLSETEYVTFDTALQNLLTDNDIRLCDLGAIMKQNTQSQDYFEIANMSTTDGKHLTNDIGRQLLRTAMKMLGIDDWSQSFNLSPQYTVVQRKQLTGCYTCGSKSHNKYHCNVTNLHCRWCDMKDHHTEAVCPTKLLPCSNCGELGHYRMSREDCPYWYKSPQEARMSQMSVTDN